MDEQTGTDAQTEVTRLEQELADLKANESGTATPEEVGSCEARLATAKAALEAQPQTDEAAN